MSADFDKAIDRAVREMLDVEPPADLRARVMAQLPAPGSRLSASGFRLPALGSRLPAFGWVLAPLAAAALIVLAIFVARRAEPLPQGPGITRARDYHLGPETPARVRVVEPPAAVPPALVTAPARRPVSGGTIAAASFNGNDDAATAIEPLKRITPIDAAPIAQASIAPAEIAVRPLNTITEVQIAPLTPPDRR
jgi:hypothetical protein